MGVTFYKDTFGVRGAGRVGEGCEEGGEGCGGEGSVGEARGWDGRGVNMGEDRTTDRQSQL